MTFYDFFRLKRIQKEKPWTTEDARAMGVDNGKPLGRAPKPIPLTADPNAPADAAAQPADAQNPPKTTEDEDITFTF